MTEKRTWKEFRDNGLLWWINRQLHLFGHAIAIEVDETGEIVDAYPVRCKFRGFTEKIETEQFEKLSNYLKKNIEDIETDLDK